MLNLAFAVENKSRLPFVKDISEDFLVVFDLFFDLEFPGD